MADIFFWCSKLFWGIVSPDGLLVMVFALAMGLWALGCINGARRLLTVLLGVIVVITLFPVGSWLLYPLEIRYPVHPDLSTSTIIPSTLVSALIRIFFICSIAISETVII